MGPPECDEIVHLTKDLSLLLEAKRRDAMSKAAKTAAAAVTATAAAAATTTAATAAAAAAAQTTAQMDADLVEELNERSEELLACAKHLDQYVRHMLRKALSHTITPALLDELKTKPTATHMIVDYKQKVLPTGFRETQTAAFGKKGKSLHGATCLRWDAKRGDFQVLNVRVVCDDSNQTWFHTLAALRTTIDKVTDVWPDLTESTLQSDGAGNYDCTAFMDSVKDVFKGACVRLTRHLVTEVGDGKNLVDQSFQGAQQTMDHARAGGMDLLDALGILEALETGKALGTINVGMDIGVRGLEPKKGPSPLKGIDSLYDREYVYNENGEFVAVRVRQFFGLGDGRLVSKAELRKLWKEDFEGSAVKPTVMLPGSGVRTVEAKLKRSHDHNLEVATAKRARENARKQRQMMASFEALAAEAQRIRERATHHCMFIGRGCRHLSFLTPKWAAKHSSVCDFRPEKAADAAAASVRVRVRVGGVVRLALTASGRVGLHGGGSVGASISLISQEQRMAARVTLSTRRPLVGATYGLQEHRAVHELSTVAAQSDAVATRPKDVRALLLVQPGSTYVHLTLSSHRPPPEMRPRGWAIRLPSNTERYTTEQRAYLAELYAWPAGRLNEQQAFELFKKRFASNDGTYARSLRLDRAQIKAWFSSEKQRQKKKGMVATLAASLPDDDDAGGDGDSVGGDAAARQKPPSVAGMRSEMETLGYATEAKAAKGAKAVFAALLAARASPRAVATRRAASESSSSEPEEEEEEEEGEDEEELWAVEDVLDMREGPPREFLVRWEGFPPEADTWEPEGNLLPSLLRDYHESISTEASAAPVCAVDSSDDEAAHQPAAPACTADSSDDEAVHQPPAPAVQKGNQSAKRKRAATQPAVHAPPPLAAKKRKEPTNRQSYNPPVSRKRKAPSL